MTHILIAEDEQRIASFIEKGLSANGFAVTTVAMVGRPTTTRRRVTST
jgi:DNA-binding response OmpR family regulator